jgi:ribonuclease P protein component
MCSLSLRAHERMRHSLDFRRVKDQGRSYRTRHFRVNYRENGLAAHRLGMVVQKRFWKAVQRNRIKRCLREFFRHFKKLVPGAPLDIVIIALPGAESCHPQEIAMEIRTGLARKESHGS